MANRQLYSGDFYTYDTGIISIVYDGRRRAIVKCDISLKDLIKSLRKWPSLYGESTLTKATHLTYLDINMKPVFEMQGELVIVRTLSDVTDYTIGNQRSFLLNMPNSYTRYFKDLSNFIVPDRDFVNLTEGTFISVNDFDVVTDDGDAKNYNEYLKMIMEESQNDMTMENLLHMATTLKKMEA